MHPAAGGQRARNDDGGYWIAEADTTDGAQRLVDHLDIPWTDVARMPETELAALLDELQRWESDSDQNGALLPRARRHDDKTLVTWSPE